MPLWYKGNKPTARPSQHVPRPSHAPRPSMMSRPSMDIRRESWLAQQMNDLQRVSRFSPTAPEQLAELRRASHVSQQMAYQRAAAEQMQQYHQQMAYQQAAAEQMRRATLHDFQPRPSYAQPTVHTSPYLHLMSPQQVDTRRTVTFGDQSPPPRRPSHRRGHHNQRRNTTFY